jgi:hypothetical protein
VTAWPGNAPATTRRHREAGTHQRQIAGLIGAVLGILASTGSVVAESSADFFTGEQITMIVPSGVGGGYDLYGRFLARFIGKHVPGNPIVVVKNLRQPAVMNSRRAASLKSPQFRASLDLFHARAHSRKGAATRAPGESGNLFRREIPCSAGTIPCYAKKIPCSDA